MAGIYIHIPFCKQKCRYCAFYSTTYHNIIDSYVDALCHELITRKKYIDEEVDTIYFGGGTPSLLSITQMESIINTLYKNFNISENAEITMEANPDDLTPEYMTNLRTLPINRISMGVQSFNNTQLQKLGRRHTAEKAEEAVRNLRKAGFRNISIDLMFALPDSTEKDWLHDLQRAISLQPEHISAYNLTYEENTPLYNDMLTGKISMLDEEENLRQFEMLSNTLCDAGYRHYEISNFAIPGHESRHNSNYWNNTAYLGCGASAHSYNGESRRWNIADVKKYISAVNANAPDFEMEYLSENERYNDTILTRLRTSEGIPLGWLERNFNESLTKYLMQEAHKHIAAGNLQLKNNNLSLTHKGIFISDAIMRDLIYID